MEIGNGIYGLLGENGVGKTTLMHLLFKGGSQPFIRSDAVSAKKTVCSEGQNNLFR